MFNNGCENLNDYETKHHFIPLGVEFFEKKNHKRKQKQTNKKIACLYNPCGDHFSVGNVIYFVDGFFFR